MNESIVEIHYNIHLKSMIYIDCRKIKIKIPKDICASTLPDKEVYQPRPLVLLLCKALYVELHSKRSIYVTHSTSKDFSIGQREHWSVTKSLVGSVVWSTVSPIVAIHFPHKAKDILTWRGGWAEWLWTLPMILYYMVVHKLVVVHYYILDCILKLLICGFSYQFQIFQSQKSPQHREKKTISQSRMSFKHRGKSNG